MSETTKQLHKRLMGYFDDWENDRIESQDLKNVAPLASVVIKNRMSELEYHQLRGTLINMPKIDWFEDESTGKSK